MKINSIKIVFASLAGVIVMPAMAQDYGNTNHMGDYDQRSHVSQSAYQLRDTIRANDLMGMTVENSQKEKLGKVKDVAVDVTSGRVIEVILSTGGFMGMGSKLTAVPASAFQYNSADRLLFLDATQQKIKDAPEFDFTEWNDAASSNQMVKTYEYYGRQPYFVMNTEGWTTNTDGSLSQTLPRNMDGTVNPQGARMPDTAHNMAGMTNGTEVTSLEDSYYQAGYIQNGSSLIGSPVKNAQGEKIGNVDNFVISLPTGRIVAIILSTGGFLGMDSQMSAVPPTALKRSSDQGDLELDASKEQMTEAPHFSSGQWPDFSRSNYAGRVYNAYNVKPYFNTNDNSQPDNTARNVRDRNHSTMTPMDQGNSQADIDITAQIRRQVVADADMSLNAKNVKIITRDGHVTLRGPVNSDQEKSRIGDIASTIARAENVSNQLEIQNTPNQNN